MSGNAKRGDAKARFAAILALGFALFAPPAGADDALIAVAANFAGAAAAISAEFAKDTGHVLVVTTGSTGKLYAQIREGAPFQALLSADAKTPEKIEAEGYAVAGSRFTYAVGRLTLWSPDDGRIGADPKAALTDAATLFIAIANPNLAPYGVAARETMRALGLWDELQPKVVMGENIGQAYSLVASGAAQVGFVSLSAVVAPGKAGKGSYWNVPRTLFQPILQDAVLLKAGEGNAAAIAFLGYLKGEKAKAIARSFGYATN